MAEPNKLVMPVHMEVETNCYPLMRREFYQFDDGSALVRQIPYWLPAVEHFIRAEVDSTEAFNTSLQ